eukprot:c18190_g1_i1 orf=3-260(-)
MEERSKRAMGVAIKGLKEQEGEEPMKVAQFFLVSFQFNIHQGLTMAYRVGRRIKGKDHILVAWFDSKALGKRAALKVTKFIIEEDL